MNNIFIKIFKNRHDFKPEWNAKNGFEIFGADIMFSNKKPYLLEINAKTGLKDTNIIIPGLVQTILENKENEYSTFSKQNCRRNVIQRRRIRLFSKRFFSNRR
jgi:hypothetical protein